MGKSSLSRYIATRVAKGAPCLGRDTTKGEVIMVSLEDADDHTDDCLSVFGWDTETDATIHILEDIPSRVSETIQVLREALLALPEVKLIVLDTMAKVLRVGDLNDFTEVQAAIRQLRELAKETGVHILALTHNKKVATENVFDSLLGSTAIRAETDCNIALYEQDQQRIIETEVRRGRKIEATIIQAKIVSSPLDGAEVVANFELMTRLDEWKSTQSERSNVTQQVSYEEKVIRYLQGCTDQSSSHYHSG